MNNPDNRQSKVYCRSVKDNVESFEEKDSLRLTCNVRTKRMVFTPFSVYLVGNTFYLDSNDISEILGCTIRKKSQLWSSDNHNLISVTTLINYLSSNPQFDNKGLLSEIVNEVEKLKNRMSWK